jgi:DnaJ-class molecular chaperone
MGLYARPAVSADEPAQDIPCPPCRGTGTVSSNLGGTRKDITCPWCEGAGRLPQGHDAQARWRQDDDDGPAAA